MNFKAYDILSALVPGFLLILALQKLFNQTYDKDYVIGYTAIAFLLGYLVNTIGSWLEDFYFITWGGKPSSRLLDGKNSWKVKLYHVDALKDRLNQKTANPNPTSDELFAIAMRNAIGEKDTRIEDFNTIYAFSRTMLTTGLIGGIALLIQHYNEWYFYVVVISVVVVLWLRCKQRGYYFAKEVLNVYSKKESI